MSNDRTLTDVLGIFGAAFAAGEAIYASSPITSGQRLHRFISDWPVRMGASRPSRTAAMRECVIEPNERDALAFARRLRREYKAPVIDPSRFRAGKGWTQDHFTSLWATVIKSYCNLVVFANGWEYSSGCTAEFVEAFKANIPTSDAKGNLLARDDAIGLMSRAKLQLLADGLSAATLSRRIQQLRLNTAGVRHPRMPQRTPATRSRLCLMGVGSVSSGRSGVLAARPDSAESFRKTGNARRRPPSTPGTSAGKERLTGESVARVKRLRNEPSDVIIDVARFAPSDWPLSQLERFWSHVIEHYVHAVGFLDEWYDDQLCTAIFGFSVRFGAKLFDDHGAKLTVRRGLSLLRVAISSLELAGIDASKQKGVVQLIERARHAT